MGVLDGVRVVEGAEHGFVPSGAAILAEWGADVVKVERPTGDPLREIQGTGLVADASPLQVIDEPQVEAHGYMPHHPGHAQARLASSPVQFDGQALRIDRGAPRVGGHTNEVLQEAGFTEDEISALIQSGAAYAESAR